MSDRCPCTPAALARVDYDAHPHRVYAEGRRLLPATAWLWRAAIRRHTEGARVHRALDLGADTSRFSAELAELLEAQVLAAEPSAGMRESARSTLDARAASGSVRRLPGYHSLHARGASPMTAYDLRGAFMGNSLSMRAFGPLRLAGSALARDTVRSFDE